MLDDISWVSQDFAGSWVIARCINGRDDLRES